MISIQHADVHNLFTGQRSVTVFDSADRADLDGLVHAPRVMFIGREFHCSSHAGLMHSANPGIGPQ